MDRFVDLIMDNQSFLVRRILHYAMKFDYTKYTSTLEEAWIMSISGLSDALVTSYKLDGRIPEIEADHKFANNAISAFGVLEAKKHRQRGVSLELYLSLMKYYRQSYLDLVITSVEDIDLIFEYQLWINRFFDHNEIAYIQEWTEQSEENLLSEMQMANIQMTNEKNKYLTIFESLPNAAILLDAEHHCINMNYAAQKLFRAGINSPGLSYYSEKDYPTVDEFIPWINDDYVDFIKGNSTETNVEKEYNSPEQGYRVLSVKFRRMLDVSNKFEGAVVIFHDLTDKKKIEEQLRYLSFHDILTGLHNRAYLDEQWIRLSADKFDPVGFISIDVDGLKLVNDNFGHAVGDSLLVNVGRILKKSFRECDVVVRMGGDEFAALIPNCDAASIEMACQRIRSNIESYNESSMDLPISISIGWSSGNLRVDSRVVEIVKEADQKMYADKKVNHSKYLAIFKDWLSNVGKNQMEHSEHKAF